MADTLRELAEDVFLDALEVPADQRAAFVQERCGRDIALRRMVEDLLRAHFAEGILELRADARSTPASVSAADVPENIGPYRIVGVLGQGGMGTVYEAHQTAPVRRRVALKVIRSGMGSREVVARFEAERQALAVMDHPNIARVFDAGTTQDGRPYFAMELVDGVPLTRYCDDAQLSTEDRVRLFLPVCGAVQHAHLKGVIHRDLKPSNILVTLQDGQPVAKIIDFGIAKAVTPDPADQVLVTRAGQIVGTPAYMSPEQAGLVRIDVDSRADVYSLGVTLYELLVGAQPFEIQDVVEAAITYLIREQDPPPPSSRLTTLDGDSQRSIASRRHTDLRSLKRQLRGDLDWVVMKAIEKDRARRYDTARGLADDLERYLANETVLARPPSPGYRLRKFARRHRAGIAAAVVTVGALVTGAAAVTTGLVRARRAEAEASAEAATAQQVSSFLVELFEVSDPGEARGNAVTAREILDQGRARIDQELVDQPAVRARLMRTMGQVYQKLGLLDETAGLYEQALAIRRGLHPGGHPDLAESINDLGEIRYLQGRYDESETLYREAIAMRRSLVDGPDLDLALSVSDLGLLHYARGEFDESEARFREALEIRRALLPPSDRAVATSLNNLGGLLIAKDDLDEAESLLREAYETLRAELGDDHPTVTAALNNLAHVLHRQGRTAEAEPLMRQILETRLRILGEDHPDVATSSNNLAVVLRELGKVEEAVPLYRRALAIQFAVVGANHPNIARASKNLAVALVDLGRFEEAEALYLDALRIFTDQFGADHALVANVRTNMAAMYDAWNRPDLAEAYRTPSGSAQD